MAPPAESGKRILGILKIVYTDAMRAPPSVDPDLLRAFVTVAEELNFTRAAERIGRTQSAVSMQIRKLEEILGGRLLDRGRGEAVRLTAHGKYLLSRSYDLLSINNEIWSRFREPEIAGEIRLGTPDDHALEVLPDILRRFSDAHPAVQISVTCASSRNLVPMVTSGDLDLALLSEGAEPENAAVALLWRGRLVWATSAQHEPHLRDPLPIAVSTGKCAWREMAVRALEAAGRRYRIAYSSESHIGNLVPVIAGLAVTLTVPGFLPGGARLLGPGEYGLPELPEYGIVMLKGEAGQRRSVEALEAAIIEAFRERAKVRGAGMSPGHAAQTDAA